LLFETAVKKLFQGKRDVPWDQTLFDDCCLQTEQNKMSVSYNKLENQEDRSSPHWKDNYTKVFIKSQWVKKRDTINKVAKPGQALTSFNNDVLLTLGPLARYLMNQIKAILPENIMFAERINQHELNDWTKKNFNFNKESLENDYTRFDQSQKAEFVNFQVHILKMFNTPEHLINKYMDIKLNCFNDISVLDFMILSGDWATLLFNTLDNAAYANLQYNIPPGTAQLYVGDDSAINHPCKKTEYFKSIEHMFSLQSKTVYTKQPGFCGWILTRHGIIKDPELINLRINLCLEQDKLIESIEGLYYEHLFAYRLDDSLYDIMDLNMLEYHQANCRFFLENRRINRFYYSKVTELSKDYSGKVFKKMCEII